MKKILFAAMAALAITSCSQNEEIEAPSQKAEIKFGTVVGVSPRADIVTNSTLTDFWVNGYKTAAKIDVNSTLTADFITDLQVSKPQVDGNWTFTGSHYWPLSGYVQFFATAPKQTLALPASGYPTFTYTVKSTEAQEDLIAANLIDQAKTDQAVILPFQHLLTQVNFSIKGKTAGFTYTVSKLEILGAKDKSTFTFDGTATVGSWGTLEASSAAGVTYIQEGTYTVAPTEETLSTAVDIDTDKAKSTFILMPQTLAANNISLKITYTAAPTAKPTEYTFNDTKEVILSGDWQKGHKIRYTLELTDDAKPVTFGAPKVSEWTTPEDTGTTTDKQ